MKKENKYMYGWKFYTNSGYGWDYENFEDDIKSMKINRKAYLENFKGLLKITRGRELNPSHPDYKLNNKD